LSLDFIRKFHITPVPDQVVDDGVVIQEAEWRRIFDHPIPPPNWVEAEDSSLENLMKNPIKYNRTWVHAHVAQLTTIGVPLTYSDPQEERDSDNEKDEPIEVAEPELIVQEGKANSEET